MRTKVISIDPALMDLHEAPHIPTSPIEALMEADEFEEPRESWLEKHLRFEDLRVALETVLEPREVWVIEAHYWRGMGYRLIGRELSLSHTHVMRIKRKALAKLRAALDPGGSTDAQP